MEYLSVFIGDALVDTNGTTVMIMILLVLLFFSFINSGAEVAYFSLTHRDINMLKTKQQLPYKRIINLIEEPKILLGSLLIANSIINVAIIVIANILLGSLLNFGRFDALWMEFIIKWVIIAATLILFGEVMPKVLAAQNNIRFAKDAGVVVELVHLLFKRASIWLVGYSDIIEKKLSKTNSFRLEELDHAIDQTTDSSTSIEEKNILKGIIKFGNIQVKQIMKTRTDVNGIPLKTSFGNLVSTLGELHYSRLPVYESNLDHIKGIIHTKDLIPYLNNDADFDWHSLMRPPYFVHEHKLIEDLLKEFQGKHIHFAVVVDEFGGTKGIVTLEDILEEVIGEIKDEFDDEEVSFTKGDDNNYVFEGKTMLNDVCRIMQLNTDTFNDVKGESDSLAGLVLEIAGSIPQAEQVLQTKNFSFTVIEQQRNRLLKIKITIKPLAD